MFESTDWGERYMLNSFQFSAAKAVTEAKLMQRAVYTGDGALKPWNQFRDDAEAIQKQVNEVWLRVERDMCARSSVMADKFGDMLQDKDIYPYWIYQGRLDSRERPEHRALEGLIFRLGDPAGDNMYPPADWNCRCKGKQVDDLFLRQGNRSVQTNSQADGWLKGVDQATGKPFVDEQFRYNPYYQGMMPHGGQYFEDFRNANQGNAALFGLKSKGDGTIDHFAASKFTDVNYLIDQWRKAHWEDTLGNIVFQNKQTLTNVFLTPEAIHAIKQHPRGAEKLTDTIERPSEIWSRWKDVYKQRVVLRNYLLFGQNISYLVQTAGGQVQDAKIISRNNAERFRIGCPVLKH